MLRIARDDPRALAEATSRLRGDGVVVLPTDTMYGLSTRFGSTVGHDRVLQIKGYAAHRPVLYLACDVEMVARYVASWGCAGRSRLATIWPAPLTAIFPAAPGPPWLGRTIAFRIPDDRWLLDLVKGVGEPVASTSTNPAGAEPIGDVEAIVQWLGGKVDLVVTAGDAQVQAPSTVVDFSGEEAVLIRAGAYPWATRGKPSN